MTNEKVQKLHVVGETPTFSNNTEVKLTPCDVTLLYLFQFSDHMSNWASAS